MEVRRDALETALIGKLGGEKVSGHHRGIKIYADGQFVGKTSISQGWRKLDVDRLGMIARQLFVSVHDLHEVVRCKKDGEWYAGHLRSIRKL